MKVRAKRGVCLGPDRHLAVGDVADVDDIHIPFLTAIGAVEVATEEAPQSAPVSVAAPADDEAETTTEEE
jgi:hypothetical protein